MDDIKKIGFSINDCGDNTIEIKGCPSDIKNPDSKEIIENIIENYKNIELEVKEKVSEKLALSLTRASVIPYGKILQAEEMQEIVDQLFACSNPNYNPVGKKVFTIVSLDELEDILK